MQKKFIAAVLSVFIVTACATPEETIALGAAAGAGVALATGGNVATGALIGGGVALACEATNTC